MKGIEAEGQAMNHQHRMPSRECNAAFYAKRKLERAIASVNKAIENRTRQQLGRDEGLHLALNILKNLR